MIELTELPAGQPDATLARATRRRNGFTQKEVAEAAGLDRGTVSRIENGCLRPTEGHRRRLAAALGLDPSELLERP